MRNRYDELRAFRAIDDLAAAPPRRLFALSPNDALVQVSLPLVLILAIVVRLMVIGQSMATANRGPVILEMWKQQLILRMDRVLSEWEQAAALPAFPEFSRIQWADGLPADDRFQQLTRNVQALDDVDGLAVALYHDALRYRPPATADGPASEGPAYYLDLYDPEAPFGPADPTTIPPEFTITPERRAYALKHMRDRLLQFREHGEALQWAVVAACAAALPLDETIPGADDEALAAAQLRRITALLDARGYPLLERVKQEYAVP